VRGREVGDRQRGDRVKVKGILYNALIPVPGRSMVDDNTPQNAKLFHEMLSASPNRTIALTLESVQQLLTHPDSVAKAILAA
jgi:hypothetical protein